MTFSDLEIVVTQVSRVHGYTRDNIPKIWTPGGGDQQHGYSRELAGALFKEADEFFDRALVLYLLKGVLRDSQASTWAGIGSYYSNYFAALSFVRLSLRSFTHMPGGSLFEVGPVKGAAPNFSIVQRKRRVGHADVWRQYYDAIQEMAWPDAGLVTLLAPTVASLRFREQLYRERINYTPGLGFEEIYMTPSRYASQLRAALQKTGASQSELSDPAYTDLLAAERLKHVAALLRRLQDQRRDGSIEGSCWRARQTIIDRYCTTRSDRKFAEDLLPTL